MENYVSKLPEDSPKRKPSSPQGAPNANANPPSPMSRILGEDVDYDPQRGLTYRSTDGQCYPPRNHAGKEPGDRDWIEQGDFAERLRRREIVRRADQKQRNVSNRISEQTVDALADAPQVPTTIRFGKLIRKMGRGVYVEIIVNGERGEFHETWKPVLSRWIHEKQKPKRNGKLCHSIETWWRSTFRNRIAFDPPSFTLLPDDTSA